MGGPGAVGSLLTNDTASGARASRDGRVGAAFGWEAALSTLYTAGLASLLGYGLFNGLLARNPSAAVVPWVLLAPVVAMLSAWLVLDQVPAPGEVLGGLLLVVGVLVALRPQRGSGAVSPSTGSRVRPSLVSIASPSRAQYSKPPISSRTRA